MSEPMIHPGLRRAVAQIRIARMEKAANELRVVAAHLRYDRDDSEFHSYEVEAANALLRADNAIICARVALREGIAISWKTLAAG